MEIFYRGKAFHAREKIRKNDFAPSEKFSCYAPATSSGHSSMPKTKIVRGNKSEVGSKIYHVG